MHVPRAPRFQWGQPVSTTVDLVNDGSFPGAEAEALLVPAGTRGAIVNVGHHVDSDTPVYMVEFADGRVIGCVEHELVSA